MDSSSTENSRYVNIKPLKRFAAENLSENNPLREILLIDDDKLDVNSFLAKVPVWLRLVRWVENERQPPGR